MTTSSLDLRDAIDLVQAAQALLKELQGRLHSDADVKVASTPAAETNRGLLYAAHLLERASAEVTATYWRGRGYGDPLVDA